MNSTTNNNFWSRNIWILLLTIFMAILFSGWGMLQLFYKFPPEMLVSSFSTKNELNLYIYNLIHNLWGAQGLIFTYEIIFPSLCFFALTKIFYRYLNKLWSVALAMVGLIVFVNYPFREFLIQLISGKPFSTLGTSDLPTIFGTQSLSFFVFLTLFYFSINHFKFPSRRLSVITCLWALYSKISFLDALFGLTFWFTYFPIRLIRQKHIKSFSDGLKEILFQLFLAGIILVLGFGHSINLVHIHNNLNIGLFYYVAYFILPILLLVLAYFVQRVDYYEIFFKFWHVYTLMAIELLVVIICNFFSFGINFNPLTGHTPLFFLHFYYYIPALYYLTRPYTEFNSGVEGSKFMGSVRKLTSLIFYKLSAIYLSVIILLLFIFAGLSANKNFKTIHSINEQQEIAQVK